MNEMDVANDDAINPIYYILQIKIINKLFNRHRKLKTGVSDYTNQSGQY